MKRLLCPTAGHWSQLATACAGPWSEHEAHERLRDTGKHLILRHSSRNDAFANSRELFVPQQTAVIRCCVVYASSTSVRRHQRFTACEGEGRVPVQATSEPSTACFDNLAAHFGELGIPGQGLETAAQGSPLVGPLIGMRTAQNLFNAESTSQSSQHLFRLPAKSGGMQKGHHTSCSKLTKTINHQGVARADEAPAVSCHLPQITERCP